MTTETNNTRLKTLILKLNLFKTIPPAEDSLTLKKQRLSTYIFLVLFIVCLTTFTLYTAVVSHIQQETVQNPSYSMYQQLFDRYPLTLSCPCTTISIPQKEFLQLNPSYHPVCSSIFVTDEWVMTLRHLQPTRFISTYFNYIAPSFFQMLASFCTLSKQLVAEELLNFNDAVIISDDVISSSSFIEQSQASIDLFISDMEANFLRLIELIRLLIDINAPISGLFTNVDYQIDPYDSYVSWVNIKQRTFPSSNCTCSRGTVCLTPAYIEIYDLSTMSASTQPVPGIYVSCYNMDAVLQSSFKLLFNQNEIDEMFQALSQTNASDGFYRSLNKTRLQRFSTNATGNELVSRLFVDSWTSAIFHEKYFKFCQPVECHYSFVSRNGLIIIVTSVLGIIGGLNTILRLLAPGIIYILFQIKNKFKKSTETENPIPTTIKTRIKNFWIQINDSIININIFQESYAVETPAYKIRNQKISTIIFIISICICFMILATNIALEKSTTIVTIKEPSYDTYQLLYQQYSEIFSCQCATISIEQGTFMDIKPTFHSICSNRLVSDEFINYLASIQGIPPEYGYHRFRFLREICNLLNRTITNSFIVFKNSRFTSQKVVPIDVFDKQIHDMINNYIMTIINTFITTLSFSQHMTIGNKLLMSYQDNFRIWTENYVYADLNYITQIYSDNCDCLIETCTTTMFILSSDSETIFLPGFYRGCYPVDYLIKSDLRCFYNDTCLNKYLSLYSAETLFNITVLDPASTKFSMNTTINELLENFFIENWNSSISHVDYYKQCRPFSCSYSISTSNDIVTIITIAIGFIGGIQIILRFLIPKLVELIFRCCQNNRTTTENSLSFSWRNYNIFPSYPPTNDKHIYRKEIISTRLFIFTFIITLIFITSFNLLLTISTTITVDSPTFDEYLDLYDKYQRSLECPCTSIAVSYSSFTSVDYSFHEICSSVYVTSAWQEIIFRSLPTDSWIYSSDFRKIGASVFQIIGSFCELADKTTINQLVTFNSRELVSKNVITENIFSEKLNASFNLFVQTTESGLQRLLRFLREIINSNVFASLTKSNVQLVKSIDMDSNSIVIQLYNAYLVQNDTDSYVCHCGPPSTCATYARLNGIYGIEIFNVTGMAAACLPSEAAIVSTLKCFYNQTCIDNFRSILGETLPLVYELDTVALDFSLPSRYSPDTTIEQILNHAMLENVNYSASFEKYYANCRPSVCSYRIQTRNNPAYAITLLLGLIGGLSNTLQIIIPNMVHMCSNLFNRFCRCNQHQIQPF